MTNAGRLFLRWGFCRTASFAFFICFSVFIILMQSHDKMRFNMKYLSKSINYMSMQSLQPCDCSQRPKMLPVVSKPSTCSDYATSRGPHQNIVSYTFFGNTSSLYFQGIELTAKAVAQSYPGWTMRLYHNFNMSVKHEADKVCEIWCKYHHLDLCDVTDLPLPLGDQSNIFGTIWRFFVLGDPLVDQFMSRDIDSPITEREVAAVNEWLQSNKTFHIMRDHPYHGTEVLAGMWGGRNSDLNLTEQLRYDFIFNGTNATTHSFDQDLLREIIWPVAVNDSVIHDSFTCKLYPNARPYPIKLRDRDSWVGHSYQWKGIVSIHSKCPVECRPKDHKDWEYC